MDKYAVLETGGKQTLVKVGQRIEIEKIAVDGVIKAKKVLNFKAKRRKGSRRLVGHRQQLTVATVKEIV